MKNYTPINAMSRFTYILIFSAGLSASNAICAFAAAAEKPNPHVQTAKTILRQIVDAATQWEKSGGCSKQDCIDLSKLVESGKIPAIPKLPMGMGDSNSEPVYNITDRKMGGCGSANIGSMKYFHPTIENVSKQFCRDYNNSVGLGKIIIGNCSSGGDCAASKSNDPYDFPSVKSTDFCYNRNEVFTVIWLTSISGGQCGVFE